MNCQRIMTDVIMLASPGKFFWLDGTLLGQIYNTTTYVDLRSILLMLFDKKFWSS